MAGGAISIVSNFGGLPDSHLIVFGIVGEQGVEIFTSDGAWSVLEMGYVTVHSRKLQPPLIQYGVVSSSELYHGTTP